MDDVSRETIIRAAQGDLGSFELIYKATAQFVYNVAFRVVRHKEEAEEVVQEVFLQVHGQLKHFRLESSLKTWVYRIAVNCALNRAKKMSKEKSRRVEYDDTIEELPAADAPTHDLDSARREKVIGELLGALNPDQRACIVLRNIEELSYEEISQTLRININTVRSRLKRAREHLMELGKGVTRDEL